MKNWKRNCLVGAALLNLSCMSSVPTAEAACPAMRWTTLGTAGGPVPTIDRSEPANLLSVNGVHFLVDTGDGTVGQLAKTGLTLRTINTVFISHHHQDHIGGLPAVIGLRWMNQFPGVLTVYGPPGTKEAVDGMIASLGPQSRIGFGIGKPVPPPANSVKVIEMTNDSTVQIGDVTIRAAANSHFDHDGPADKNPPVSLSFRFETGSKSITYSGDTGPSAAFEKLAIGTDLLVSEVMNLDRVLADIKAKRTDAPPQLFAEIYKHMSTHHLRPEDVGEIAKKAQVKNVLLTHFATAGLLNKSEAYFRAGVAKHYQGRVDLAHDLSSYSVGCSE